MKLNKFQKRMLFGSCIGLIIIIGSVIFLSETRFFQSGAIMGVMIAASFPAILGYVDSQRVQVYESKFPIFLIDIVSSMESDMTLPQAINLASSGDYGDLTSHIRALNKNISWGKTFEESMKKFSNDCNSPGISRSVSVIVGSYKSGGEINQVLRAVAENLLKIKQVKTERASDMQTQIITGYAIFIIFLFIILVLTNILLPAIGETSQALEDNVGGEVDQSFLGEGNEIFQFTSPDEIYQYKVVLFHMCLIEGLFTGLIIGQMTSGNVVNGVKHSLVLFTIAFMVFSVIL
ncbi:MAG: type II secretion system F family protein [Candidatus Diapherotrites archaeon]|nr:type II secretion system F family protein [Candidatus Diapherotrites archaeon]